MNIGFAFSVLKANSISISCFKNWFKFCVEFLSGNIYMEIVNRLWCCRGLFELILNKIYLKQFLDTVYIYFILHLIFAFLVAKATVLILKYNSINWNWFSVRKNDYRLTNTFEFNLKEITQNVIEIKKMIQKISFHKILSNSRWNKKMQIMLTTSDKLLKSNRHPLTFFVHFFHF